MTMGTGSLLGPIVSVGHVAAFLDANHYLGRATRGFAWADEFGVLVLANPTSRRLPHDRWIELIRWCLVGVPNGGSQQWARVVRWLRLERPEVTTVVSYSDPSQGHTGALYKACNWRWAPTWMRLFPPPSAHGAWPNGRPQAVKDRWVYELRRDPKREEILRVKDTRFQPEMLKLQHPSLIPADGVVGNDPGNQSGSAGSTPALRSQEAA